MSEGQVIETGSEGLRFEFNWFDAHECGPTYGNLAVSLGGQTVWPAPAAGVPVEGITALWIELLEFLGRYWLYLNLEQGYPFNVSAQKPSTLDYQLAKRWENMSDEQQAQEEDEVYAFRLGHNLAEASPGTLRPDLWLVRDGGTFLVEAPSVGQFEHLAAADVKRVLVAVGQAIATRIADEVDPRSRAALSAWANRNNADLKTQAKIVTGLPDDYLNETRGAEPFDVFFADPESTWAGDNVTLEVAYRFKGKIRPDRLRPLLIEIKAASGALSDRLRAISREAEAQLESIESTFFPPYQQGKSLAIWLRSRLNINSGRAEPEVLLSDWGVSVGQYDFSSTSVDAIAYWAHDHSPRVLWNPHVKHTSNEGARRATLSHEICHLLVDRSALPLTAVVGGAMERRLEQRANAFAAEFLCPRREAAAEYQRDRDVVETIHRLTDRFGVSDELATLQLARSGQYFSTQGLCDIEELGPPGASYPWSR